MSSTPDTTPPANVTGLTASVTSGHITLSWTNPTDADFAGVVIRKSTTAFPAETNEGIEPVGAELSETSYRDDDVSGVTTYYYTVFALDTNQNYQTGGTTIQVNYNDSEINIVQGATTILSGGSYDFGDILVGSSSGNITFTIQNTGSSNLSISSVVLSGTNSDQFTLNDSSTASSVSGGSNTTFTITFNPDSLGIKDALITINNGDSDEGTYTINITGKGVAPEINVQQSSTSIADGGSYDFGSKTYNTSTTATFTIRNIGTSNLTISSITLTGTNASEFSLDDSSIPATIPESGSVTFAVTFNPTTAGNKTAVIIINNNDSDEGSYEITLNGIGVILFTASTEPRVTSATADTYTVSWTPLQDAVEYEVYRVNSWGPTSKTLINTISGNSLNCSSSNYHYISAKDSNNNEIDGRYVSGYYWTKFYDKTFNSGQISDNFNDNIIDSNYSITRSVDTIESNGYLQLTVNTSNNFPLVYIGFNSGNKRYIRAKYKFYAHRVNDHSSFIFDIISKSNDAKQIDCDPATYDTYFPRYGTYLGPFQSNSKYESSGYPLFVQLSSINSFEIWNDLQLIIDKQDKKVSFYLNDTKLGEDQFFSWEIDSEIIFKFAMTGWYTGHYVRIDDLEIKSADTLTELGL